MYVNFKLYSIDGMTPMFFVQDLTFGRTIDQQLEMASYITLLSVDFDCDNFEAIPTSWLTHWLSDPDDDCVIDNEKYSCNHGKLDPSEVSNVKYINSEMVKKNYNKISPLILT